jgi:hypothetical protein
MGSSLREVQMENFTEDCLPLERIAYPNRYPSLNQWDTEQTLHREGVHH